MSLYIVHRIPNRTIQFGNCKIPYHHFLDGGGDPDSWLFSSGPGNSYPNDFWYQQARINLFRCMLDEYTKTKDSTIARALNDSIFKDRSLTELYISLIYKSEELNEACMRFTVDMQQNKKNIPSSLLTDSLRCLAEKYRKNKNPIDAEEFITYIFHKEMNWDFFKYYNTPHF